MDHKSTLYLKGNRDLLELPKTAFLCSRDIPASAVLKCYDWAIEQREKGNCIISGFQSRIEKDVLHYLLQGQQPIIIALARGLKKHLEPQLQSAYMSSRLLIVSIFPESIIRPTVETSEKRNRMMIETADETVLGYVNPKGTLAQLMAEYEGSKKMIIL